MKRNVRSSVVTHYEKLLHILNTGAPLSPIYIVPYYHAPIGYKELPVAFGVPILVELPSAYVMPGWCLRIFVRLSSVFLSYSAAN